MKSFLVANPKGGSGKSTLATNLAGYFAQKGHAVMLGDVDKQQSSRAWLSIRPANASRIHTWEITKTGPARPPKGTTHAILDTPSGLHGKMFEKVIRQVNHVIVPVQPSLFDILATQRFLDKLLSEKAIRKEKISLAVIGMRVDTRTRAASELERFLESYQLPILTYLRDTQLYIQLAAYGLTLFDIAPSKTAKDIEQWAPIINWAENSHP